MVQLIGIDIGGTNLRVGVVEDGKIVRRAIKLGIRSAADVEIVDGLKGDETVVLLQPASFKAGQSVEIREKEAK